MGAKKLMPQEMVYEKECEGRSFLVDLVILTAFTTFLIFHWIS